MAEDELTRLRAENVRLKNELDKPNGSWAGTWTHTQATIAG